LAQLIRITSEALQATVRRLLPSQQGFGEDLEASNVITPIIDLTPTAEGSQLPADLARSFSFGSITNTTGTNQTLTIVDTPGFYRIFGQIRVISSSTGTGGVNINMSDGLSVKKLVDVSTANTTGVENYLYFVDFNVFLDTNDTISADANSNGFYNFSSWQVADRYGNLNNPDGFTFE
tara:strand:- start:1350 stop:1883 length:534 start_codon:yes stop_codon:yes gene_type:complete